MWFERRVVRSANSELKQNSEQPSEQHYDTLTEPNSNALQR
jgi:hypothetical protein